LEHLSLLYSNNIWQSVLDKLESKHKDNATTAFLEAFHFLGIENSYVLLSAPDSFRMTWIDSNYKDLVNAVIQEIDPSLLGYQIQVKKSKKTLEIPKLDPQNLISLKKKSTSVSEIETLYPHYSFDNLVLGPHNLDAYKASLALMEDHEDMRVLYVHGKTGLGKTHLLQSILRSLLEKQPQKRSLYRSAGQFIEDYTARYKVKYPDNKILTQKFSDVYETVDVLIIDDIELLENKQKTQETFSLLIEKLLMNGKSVVLSADKALSELVGFSEKMIHILGRGFSAELKTFDYEGKLEFAKRNLSTLIEKSDEGKEILNWIASTMHSNVREFEGFLKHLQARAELLNKKLCLNFLQTLGEPIKLTNQELNIPCILNVVSSYFSVQASDICSQKQSKKISSPRQIAMYLCRELTSETLKNIGDFFERDYSTVISSIKKVNNKLNSCVEFQHQMNELRGLLTQ